MFIKSKQRLLSQQTCTYHFRPHLFIVINPDEFIANVLRIFFVEKHAGHASKFSHAAVLGSKHSHAGFHCIDHGYTKPFKTAGMNHGIGCTDDGRFINRKQVFHQQYIIPVFIRREVCKDIGRIFTLWACQHQFHVAAYPFFEKGKSFEQFNDVGSRMNGATVKEVSIALCELIAHHIAGIFIRRPVQLFCNRGKNADLVPHLGEIFQDFRFCMGGEYKNIF